MKMRRHMSIKELIQKEQEFAAYEFQLRIRADIDEDVIHHLGARKIGSVLHEDRFFIAKGKKISETDELIRVRKEDGHRLLFTYRGPVADRTARNRLVINKTVDAGEISDLHKNYR